MNTQTRIYVALITLGATAASIALYVRAPQPSAEELTAVLLLAGLAVVAEMLVFLLPRAKGSIAFIPYLAAVLIVPGWLAVVTIAAVKATMETLTGARRLLVVFNVAQHALTSAAAIAVFLGLGGRSLLSYPT